MRFCFLPNGQNDGSISWDDHDSRGDQINPIAAQEDNFYDLSIEGCPSDVVDFEIKTGDISFASGSRVFGPCAYVERKQYFESAAGQTEVVISGMNGDGIEIFQTQQKIYVIPSKIGGKNYQKMVCDLDQICRSLINDLVGKSKHGKIWNYLQKRSFRSHEEEFIVMHPFCQGQHYI